MSKAETNVQFFCSENFKAPALDNNFGDLINLLDVCLVKGITLPIIKSTSQDGSQITLTFSEPHLLKMFQVVRLSNFSPNVLNEDFRIIGVPNANSVVIESSERIDKVGVVSLKPLGYEKSFTAYNKAVYRSANTSQQSRPFLRIDNSLDANYGETYAKYAKVGILETCNSIDDISGLQIPFDSSTPTKNWESVKSDSATYNGWSKWYYARAARLPNGVADTTTPTKGTRTWYLVGSEDAFYLITDVMQPSTTESDKLLYGFGTYRNAVSNRLPYFLLSSLTYQSITSSPTSSDSFIPFYSKNSGCLIFSESNDKHITATPAHQLYQSGLTDLYKNPFVVMPYNLVDANNYLVGTLPLLLYVGKSSNRLNKLSTTTFNNHAYLLCDAYVGGGGYVGQYAFNLGEI